MKLGHAGQGVYVLSRNAPCSSGWSGGQGVARYRVGVEQQVQNSKESEKSEFRSGLISHCEGLFV